MTAIPLQLIQMLQQQSGNPPQPPVPDLPHIQPTPAAMQQLQAMPDISQGVGASGMMSPMAGGLAAPGNSAAGAVSDVAIQPGPNAAIPAHALLQQFQQFQQQQAARRAQMAAGAMGQGYAGASPNATGSYGFNPAASPNMQQAQQLHAKWQADDKNFLNNRDMERRFAPGSIVDNRPPLVKSTTEGTDAALPAWAIKGPLEAEAAEIASAPPAIRRALEARDADHGNTYGHLTQSNVDPLRDPENYKRAMAQEHGEHLVRAKRRAGMHGAGESSVEASDRALLGDKYDTIHGAAEAKRDAQRSELMKAVAEGVGNDPLAGIDPSFRNANPQEYARMVEARMRQQSEANRTRAEGQWRGAENDTQRAIGMGHDKTARENAADTNKTHREIARDTAAEKSLDNDPTYKGLALQAGEAAQLYRDQKITRADYERAQANLATYLQGQAARRQGGVAPGTQGAVPAPPAPGIPGAGSQPAAVQQSAQRSILDQSDTKIDPSTLPDVIDTLLTENKGRLAGPFGPDTAGPLLARLQELGITQKHLREYHHSLQKSTNDNSLAENIGRGLGMMVGKETYDRYKENGRFGDEARRHRTFLNYLLGTQRY